MVSSLVSEILLGIYLGLIAGIFPAFIAFSIGFGFKYFTDITVPGLGVVVLGGALAGVSGGLMGLVDPQLTESWAGVTAILVILMASLWAHSQGDKLAAATPRRLTLKALRVDRLSADLADRVDSYGQVRIRPAGAILDMEGYPPLSDELRAEMGTRSWRFPGNLPVSELESRLEDRLAEEHELAEVSVTMTGRGLAQIRAAPTAAGLSRRVEPGKRAVSIQTLLPTGVSRGDTVTLHLPDTPVVGPVLSARTTEEPPPIVESSVTTDELEEAPGLPDQPKAPTTTGGSGQITLSVSQDEARRVIRSNFAPMTVHSQGGQPEFEAIGVLKRHGNRFRQVEVGVNTAVADTSIGAAHLREKYGVAVLAIRRRSEVIIGPGGQTILHAGDSLIVVGRPEHLREFAEVAE